MLRIFVGVLGIGECGSDIRNTRSPVPNKDTQHPSDALLYLCSLLDSSLRSGKPRQRVSQYPPDHAAVVVYVADDVVQCGEAMQLALLLHLAELMLIEFRLSDHTPVVSCRVHRKAGRQSAVRPDDQRIAARAAA